MLLLSRTKMFLEMVFERLVKKLRFRFDKYEKII